MSQPTITSRSFGQTTSGEDVQLFTITTESGIVAEVMDYGATLVRLQTPDRDGVLGDVSLGFDSILPYETKSPYFGSTVGRVANRIAKRRFTLDGQEYTLAINNGPNALHGGIRGYSKRVWQTQIEDGLLKFSLIDPDGTEGYPGEIRVEVVYRLTADGVLSLEYTATSTAATPINLTNHAYFNLLDGGEKPVLDHVVQVNADRYTPVDDTLIPTGQIAPVEGTPIDFRQPKPIGRDIEAMGGYDHNLVLNGPDGELRHIAMVHEPETGRTMEVWTTEPGVQLYTGNFLDGSIEGRNGAHYGKHHGFCLETQHFPDSPNQPHFPNAILRPGETYRQTTQYRFGVG